MSMTITTTPRRVLAQSDNRRHYSLHNAGPDGIYYSWSGNDGAILSAGSTLHVTSEDNSATLNVCRLPLTVWAVSTTATIHIAEA
jgi:hypothetical protein